MCIRDRDEDLPEAAHTFAENVSETTNSIRERAEAVGEITCLLYTSDAADERSSVDLGGRRIIKKKKCEKRAELGREKQKKINRNRQQ